jgi:hypothetical protein
LLLSRGGLHSYCYGRTHIAGALNRESTTDGQARSTIMDKSAVVPTMAALWSFAIRRFRLPFANPRAWEGEEKQGILISYSLCLLQLEEGDRRSQLTLGKTGIRRRRWTEGGGCSGVAFYRLEEVAVPLVLSSASSAPAWPWQSGYSEGWPRHSHDGGSAACGVALRSDGARRAGRSAEWLCRVMGRDQQRDVQQQQVAMALRRRPR